MCTKEINVRCTTVNNVLTGNYTVLSMSICGYVDIKMVTPSCIAELSWKYLLFTVKHYIVFITKTTLGNYCYSKRHQYCCTDAPEGKKGTKKETEGDRGLS